MPLRELHLYLEAATQVIVTERIQLDPSVKNLSSWDEAKGIETGEVWTANCLDF